MKKPLLLCIMDGFGINDEKTGNAVDMAKTPNLDKLFSEYPNTTLQASGMAVGLPDGQMGNSEVGHTNIGAGRIVYQELTRITKSIADGDFFENEALLLAVENCKKNDSALHIMGLLSDGGVHSHNTHIYGIVELAKRMGLTKVFVHCFLDGRDVPPSSGKDFVAELAQKLEEIGVGKIATVMGRYYAMDRDNRWDRVEKAYNAMVKGEGETAACGVCAVASSYEKEVTDEFVIPTVIVEDGKPVGVISENDSVVFANFRPDRAREITRTIVDEDFSGFSRKFFKTYFVCMTQYDKTMPNVDVAFKPQVLTNTLGEYLSLKGKKQLRIAETEKYAHVTFFFNGGVEKVSEGEDRALINSPKVATYDLQPEMSAPEVCENVLKALDDPQYGFILVNFANPDMVGHTGVFEAAVKACETVDTCVGKIAQKAKENGVVMLLTADHGNSECMEDPETHSPFTAHTTNPVPFMLINGNGQYELKDTGALCDVAPTVLALLGIEKPADMTGDKLIK